MNLVQAQPLPIKMFVELLLELLAFPDVTEPQLPEHDAFPLVAFW
jgi:hypothetical protein